MLRTCTWTWRVDVHVHNYMYMYTTSNIMPYLAASPCWSGRFRWWERATRVQWWRASTTETSTHSSASPPLRTNLQRVTCTSTMSQCAQRDLLRHMSHFLEWQESVKFYNKWHWTCQYSCDIAYGLFLAAWSEAEDKCRREAGEWKTCADLTAKLSRRTWKTKKSLKRETPGTTVPGKSRNNSIQAIHSHRK